MVKKLNKLTNTRSLAYLCLFCLTMIWAGYSASLAYADIQGEMSNASTTFLQIIINTVAPVTGGLLVIVAVVQLIQRNWSATASFLVAAILLIKLKDLITLFGGKF